MPESDGLELWKLILFVCAWVGFNDRLEKEITKFVPQTEFANDVQPKSVKFAQMPDYIEQFKEKPELASFLGGCVAAKVCSIQAVMSQ